MNKKIGRLFKGDKVIWMVYFFLCMISLIEVFSASSGLTYKTSNYISPLMKHAGMLAIGFFALLFTMNIPCRYFKIFQLPLLLASWALLIVVLFLGQDINGAQRVLSIAGITFQPSEIAKGTIMLIEAQILGRMQTENGADRNAFRYIILLTGITAFFIGLENLSTAALLCLVVFLMMIVGRVPVKQLGQLVGGILIFGLLVLSGVMLVGHDTRNDNPDLTKTETIEKPHERGALAKVFHRADTWKTRIDKFFDDKPVSPQEYDLDKDAQVAHANIAIVSSNIIGRGPGNSEERDFLAQAFSDFIYAIIIEEMGITGAIVVAFLYIVLLFRAARIASRCENNFPAFLVMGLSLMLVVQAVFNMLVAVGFVPVTGQPLPLISKGGTSTIINCIYIGAILSVSRTAKTKPEPLQELKQTENEQPAAA